MLLTQSFDRKEMYSNVSYINLAELLVVIWHTGTFMQF